MVVGQYLSHTLNPDSSMAVSSPIQLNPVLKVIIDDRTTVYCLEQSRYPIGRSIQCSIRLYHREVSRWQATLIREPQGGYQLVDGDGVGTTSSNGTYVNGQLIHQRVLQFGDVIQFGSSAVTAYYYQELSGPMPPPAHWGKASDDEPTASIVK